MNLHIWFNKFIFFGFTRRKVITLILLPLLATASEIFGLGIFLPIFQFIRLEGDLNALVLDSNLWQYIIDGFSFFKIEPSLAILLLLAFSLFLGRQILNFIRLIYTAKVTQYLIRMQRNRMFGMYIEADTSYHSKTPVGSLVNIITQEVDAAIATLMGPLELIGYVIMLAGYLVVLSILSWEMTLFASTALIVSGFIPKVWIQKSGIVGRKLVSANILISEFLVGRLRSPRLVRLSGTESAEKEEFYRLTSEQCKHIVLSSVLKSKTDSLIEPVIITLSLVFLYFSYTVLHLQVEVIGLYIVVLMRLMPIAKSVLMKIQSIKNSMGSMEVLEKRFNDMERSAEKDNGVKTLNRVGKFILVDNISYRYPEAKINALNSVNIKFDANKMTAIVGPSGSGKSTLIDLLPRLRLPADGVIQIDSSNIEIYKLKSLRQLISYTPQFPQIFNGTVKNHILYGNKTATDDEVQEVLSLSGIENFVDQLPQGVDTVLGEEAVKLSGGQRQRLDLARALIRKSAILILDEPTSNLDAESADKFKKVLCKIHQDTSTTIIIVSHHLASISGADKIIVLNKGVVESTGTHTELLNQNGWYAKAWNMQNPLS
jgi:ABC-type multidrug transport system fused ATPase/permease subunit